jgi:hypothetical protein
MHNENPCGAGVGKMCIIRELCTMPAPSGPFWKISQDSTDSHVRLFESIMQKLTLQNSAAFSQSHRVPPDTAKIPGLWRCHKF